MTPEVQAALVAALATLVGAVLGFTGSQITEIYRISKESKNKQKEIISEKRIKAHDLVLIIAQGMIAMRPVKAKTDENFARGPFVIESLSTFEKFYSSFIDVHSETTTWLWVDTKREMNYCQDYFLSLYMLLKQRPDIDYEQLSADIRQDFIDMSENLRKSSLDFLANKMPNLDFKDINEWHKYKKQITINRINKSNLGKLYLKANG